MTSVKADISFGGGYSKSSLPIDIADLVLYIQSVVEHYPKEWSFVNYLFTNDEEIFSINTKHLQHNYATDIITFQYENLPIEADIVISLDTVKENAEHFGISYQSELLRVVAHGILHCIGYNDRTEEEKREMRNQEEICLTLHKVSRETNSDEDR